MCYAYNIIAQAKPWKLWNPGPDEILGSDTETRTTDTMASNYIHGF